MILARCGFHPDEFGEEVAIRYMSGLRFDYEYVLLIDAGALWQRFRKHWRLASSTILRRG